jgi:hypothetical protein
MDTQSRRDISKALSILPDVIDEEEENSRG